MAQAADRVILTVERIVPTGEPAKIPELTLISKLTVAAVVEAAGGAGPVYCAGCYDVDHAGVRRYLEAARTPGGLTAYLAAGP